ncbi:MAG TPA: ribonuclease HII, partial [Methanocorpusculum sp.]|nr:ribonuclease HII [Methanocorpusculum sp.]
ISDLKNEVGNVGSGYPSDPVTIQFLEEYIDRTGKIPVCARKTWATTNDIFKKRSQHTLF